MKTMKELSIAQGRITYYLTETNIDGEQTYGIKVATTLFGGLETEHIKNITSNYDYTEELFYLLADNTVLPSTLREVVEEYISSIECRV